MIFEIGSGRDIEKRLILGGDPATDSISDPDLVSLQEIGVLSGGVAAKNSIVFGAQEVDGT